MIPGQLISNRFRIDDLEHDLLGRGGMGTVYRATDTLTGELVAVKVLEIQTSEVSRTSEVFQRFMREGEALRRLNHPNIVRMVAAVEEAGRHYLVMEYLPGGSLRDLLKEEGRLPVARAAQIALELADALTRAHHLGILHRDLKPENILLAADGSPRLADFGLARLAAASRLTQSGMLTGTLDYVSPESCRGEPADERSDIWSFGVMLFEMLAGCLPFRGDTFAARLNAILTLPVPDLGQVAPGVPDALADLLYQMLEKDPEQRIPSVRLVAAELESTLKGWKTPSPVRLAPIPLAASPAQLPSFLDEEAAVERPVFVTRESELAKLDGFLNMALAGQGRVVFVTGEAGQGKTALVQEFGWRAQAAHPDLLFVDGNCNAYTGVGDPYLPFREVLALLAGDVEERRRARAIPREQAVRLWHAIPLAVQALVETGPDLFDVLVPGGDLVRRVAAFTPWRERASWLARLEELGERRRAAQGGPGLQQSALFEQYARVLWAVAHHRPLLLAVDDLQWADGGSVGLLFHLARRIAGHQVLIVGAYRPTELELGRREEQHPLAPIVNECKRLFGQIEVDLRQAEGQPFVDALLDSEPNRLGEAFRETLFRRTGGYPLATVELLRDMQERGGLVRDRSGRWVEGPTLDWESLPARVEAMVAERIGRLDEQARELLRVASVEGETFTAEVVARVLAADERGIVTRLSGELDRGHRLVNAQGIRRSAGQPLSIYRFRHSLFHRYVYNSLDPVERAHLHQEVGSALQALYGASGDEISVQLARHFQEAGTAESAAACLSQAGDRASQLIAPQEAVDHYRQAMTTYGRAFGDRWDPLQRAVLERKIGEALFLQGLHQQASDHLLRALAYLSKPLPKTRSGVLWAVLRQVARQAGHRLLPRLFLRPVPGAVSQEYEERRRISESLGWITASIDPELFLLITLQTLNLDERNGFLPGIVEGLATLGMIADLASAPGLAEFYGRRAADLAEQIEQPAALGMTHTTLALHENIRGRWQAALNHAQRAADVFQSHWNPRGWAFALTSLADAHIHRGDFRAALDPSRELVRFGQERADNQALCWGSARLGFALRGLGQLQESASNLESALALAQSVPDYQTYVDVGGELGHCYLRQGKLELAMDVYDECRRCSLEHNLMQSPVLTRFRNGLAEVYLAAAEQSSGSEKAAWIEKAERACKDALKQGRTYRPGLPETDMLHGRLQWLRGNPGAARKAWQRSLALAEELDERYDLAATHLEMGLRQRDRTHLERAEAILAEIGAEWDLARAREALGAI